MPSKPVVLALGLTALIASCANPPGLVTVEADDEIQLIVPPGAMVDTITPGQFVYVTGRWRLSIIRGGLRLNEIYYGPVEPGDTVKLTRVGLLFRNDVKLEPVAEPELGERVEEKFTDGEEPWLPLFDGTSLGAWESISYGGEGLISIEDGAIDLLFGSPLTGLRYAGALDEILPASREGYELRLQAKRISGTDFFCGLTFPVGPRGQVTLICGGWGGSLVGFSSLDGKDASQNDTSTYQKFEKNRWYDIRVRVTAGEVQAWIDGESRVLVDRSKVGEFSLRAEVEPSGPLGISCFQTHAAVRAIQARALPAPR